MPSLSAWHHLARGLGGSVVIRVFLEAIWPIEQTAFHFCTGTEAVLCDLLTLQPAFLDALCLLPTGSGTCIWCLVELVARVSL